MTTRPGHLLFVAAAFLVAPLWATSANADGVTLRCIMPCPPIRRSTLSSSCPGPRSRKESGARLHLRLFPASQMGERRRSSTTRWRASPISSGPLGLHAGPLSGVRGVRVPLMASSAQGSSRALWKYVRLNHLSRTEFDGVRLLVAASTTRRNSPAQPARRTAADLAGLKIAAPARSAGSLLAALGAAPVEMPPARSRRPVDLHGRRRAVTLGCRVRARARRTAEIPHGTRSETPWLYSAVFVLAMNPATYKSLPDDLRKVINANSGADTSAWLGRVFDAAAASARQAAADRGDAIDELPGPSSRAGGSRPRSWSRTGSRISMAAA